jgi:hypothetical protein
MGDLDGLILDYDFGGAGDLLIGGILGDEQTELESAQNVSSRSIKIFLKRQLQLISQQDNLKDVIKTYPATGEQVHVVSANKFDFWTFVPVMIDWLETTENLYCSTWTANRSNVVDMFKIWDTRKITGIVTFVTGIYFKRREHSVYTTLVEGLLKRGGRYKAFETHAKVLLLNNVEKNVWLSVEGSANLTQNPRLEQYVITNDKRLYDFHRDWIEESLKLETKSMWGSKENNAVHCS